MNESNQLPFRKGQYVTFIWSTFQDDFLLDGEIIEINYSSYWYKTIYKILTKNDGIYTVRDHQIIYIWKNKNNFE